MYSAHAYLVARSCQTSSFLLLDGHGDGLSDGIAADNVKYTIPCKDQIPNST
jgi:hypothetical protein